MATPRHRTRTPTRRTMAASQCTSHCSHCERLSLHCGQSEYERPRDTVGPAGKSHKCLMSWESIWMVDYLPGNHGTLTPGWLICSTGWMVRDLQPNANIPSTKLSTASLAQSTPVWVSLRQSGVDSGCVQNPQFQIYNSKWRFAVLFHCSCEGSSRRTYP